MAKKYVISKIGFSTQMHGIVICDKNGDAITPFYTWQDESGKEYTEKTGIPSGYGLSTLYALITNHGLPSNAFKISTIADFCIMKLCGKKAPTVHISNAASFGLFDIENAQFDAKKCEMLGIDLNLLPTLSNTSQIVGYYDTIPCYVSIGDNQASILANYDEKIDTLFVNYGTGSQISYICNSIIHNNQIETRPFINGKTLNCGCGLCGGRAYSILHNFFAEFAKKLGKQGDVYEVLNEFASEGFDAPLNVNTQFAGTRQNPSLLGSITDISESNFSPATLSAGVLYGMANELYAYYENMGKPKFDRIIASGGGIQKNNVLLAVLEKVFDHKVEKSNIKEEAAYGACLFTM